MKKILLKKILHWKTITISPNQCFEGNDNSLLTLSVCELNFMWFKVNIQ